MWVSSANGVRSNTNPVELQTARHDNKDYIDRVQTAPPKTLEPCDQRACKQSAPQKKDIAPSCCNEPTPFAVLDEITQLSTLALSVSCQPSASTFSELDRCKDRMLSSVLPCRSSGVRTCRVTAAPQRPWLRRTQRRSPKILWKVTTMAFYSLNFIKLHPLDGSQGTPSTSEFRMLAIFGRLSRTRLHPPPPPAP